MKRIIGFFTILFLVLAIAGTNFATQQEMMKKQTTMMSSKQTTMRKQRKKIRFRKVLRQYKGKKMVRKSAIK